MQAKFEDLNVRKGNVSFRAFRREDSRFELDWHYHHEYEITLIEKGNGIRLVGDSYQKFESGDLVMIGKELPHTWATDKLMKGTASAVVIQFHENLLESFLALPEFDTIKNMLVRSQQGLLFPLRKTVPVIGLVKSIPLKNEVDKIFVLLQILIRLSNQPSVNLASAYYQPIKRNLNEKRITKICQFIQKNFVEKISLSEIARLNNLSESAFCKFFKRTTGKTFSDYVNDIRIGYACHLLSDTDKIISDISYSSGFESLSYFNRVFLKKKGIRPKDFRIVYGQKLMNSN
jgi:AraC-like DNA-binding protein